MKKLLLAAVALLIAVATPAVAGDSVLRSLPAEVQKDIESIRAGYREHFGHLDADEQAQTWFDHLAREVPRVSSGDEGLGVFTVSGAQAVMVSETLPSLSLSSESQSARVCTLT